MIWCSLTITHFEKLANFRYIWTPPLSIFLVFTKSVTTFVTILSLDICHVTLQELENVQLNPNPNPNSSPWIKPIKPACNCAHYPISVAFLIMWFSIWNFRQFKISSQIWVTYFELKLSKNLDQWIWNSRINHSSSYHPSFSRCL